MAKPPRSPLLGYNHNLTHLGRVFHIQTEDSGPVSPRLFTHLFYEGTILVSRKHEYDATLPDDKVRALMQAQHKTVMKDLMRSRLDGVIIPFFAARGEDLPLMQGAVPSAALSETPGPMMVLPQLAPTPDHVAAGTELHAGAVAGAAAVPARPRRTATRSFDAPLQRGPTPTPIVVRPPDGRRSPFVSSSPPAAARMSSTDGVVVQRNMVVGGSGSVPRPTRIRPPVPYVVTGGGHTERPPRTATQISAGPAVAGGALPGGGMRPSTLAPLVGTPLPAMDGGSRSGGGFGVGLVDDKSLDEVILEYLAEDGDPA